MVRIRIFVMSGIGSLMSRWGFGVFMPHASAIWAAGFHTSVVNARAELTYQSGLLERFAVISRMSGGCLFLYYL